MAEPLIVQSLKDKRAEIHGRIATYQAQIAQAMHDLAHINASIRLFTDPDHQRARYVSHGFFKKGEIADICLRHLEIDRNHHTTYRAVMIERKLDATDTTLRNSFVFKVDQALRHAARRKLVRMVEKRKGMCHWMAGDAITLRVVVNSRTTSDDRTTTHQDQLISQHAVVFPAVYHPTAPHYPRPASSLEPILRLSRSCRLLTKIPPLLRLVNVHYIQQKKIVTSPLFE